jgi:hypothetical protein
MFLTALWAALGKAEDAMKGSKSRDGARGDGS